MGLDDLAVEGDRNLAECWLTMARCSGAPHADLGDVVLAAQGLPIAFFNGAYVRRPGPDAATAVQRAVEFFAPRDVPWLLWVRDGVWPELEASAVAAGLRPAGGPPGMVLPAIPPPPPLPPRLQLEVVADISGIEAHGRLLASAFGMPPSFVDRLLSVALLGVDDFAMIVGWVGGQAVSTAALFISGSTAGVYNVATPAEHRGKGYGEALTWAAVAEGARRGCTHSVLQASDMGAPVYRRMGYVEVGRYLQFEGPPTM